MNLFVAGFPGSSANEFRLRQVETRDDKTRLCEIEGCRTDVAFSAADRPAAAFPFQAAHRFQIEMNLEKTHLFDPISTNRLH